MKVLIVKEHWARLILEGKKTWEIRGRTTLNRGKIAIAISGTGKVYGTVDLIDSIPVKLADLLQNKDKHHIPDESLEMMYDNPHAWIMTKVEKFVNPVPFVHKRGAVIFVNDDGLEERIKNMPETARFDLNDSAILEIESYSLDGTISCTISKCHFEGDEEIYLEDINPKELSDFLLAQVTGI